MQLSGISSLLTRLPALAPLADRSDSIRAYGLLSAAKPAVLAAMRARIAGPLLVVAAHPHRARELCEELAVWTDHQVALFPAIESLPYERVLREWGELGYSDELMDKIFHANAQRILGL